MLLLAQPRAFSLDEQVALDAWIGKGGKALILADPQLRWPMDWPLGDRRRPPAVTLLAALIEYWGVRMTPTSSGDECHCMGDGRESGRASCRERVCQDVELLGFDVHYK